MNESRSGGAAFSRCHRALPGGAGCPCVGLSVRPRRSRPTASTTNPPRPARAAREVPRSSCPGRARGRPGAQGEPARFPRRRSGCGPGRPPVEAGQGAARGACERPRFGSVFRARELCLRLSRECPVMRVHPVPRERVSGGVSARESPLPLTCCPVRVQGGQCPGTSPLSAAVVALRGSGVSSRALPGRVSKTCQLSARRNGMMSCAPPAARSVLQNTRCLRLCKHEILKSHATCLRQG